MTEARPNPAIAGPGLLAVGASRLEYAAWPGRRRGPTLVLLHEGLGSVALWRDFPQALATATGLPVLCYSRAGYGGSSPITLPRPLDFHTREALEVLPAVLDAAGIDDCILVGHSDGASIALIYCGTHADPRVRALAVLAPHVLTEAKTIATITAARSAYDTGDLRERLARRHGANVDNAFRGWSECWLAEGFRAWNIEAAVRGIRVPVMTIRGDDDPYSSAVHVERIALALGTAVETVAIPDCGHAPQLDRPEAVLTALTRFVARVVPAATG